MAVGFQVSGGGEDAAVWTSPDGINWTRVPHDENVFGGGKVMVAVAAGGPLVAVGYDLSGDDLDTIVWTTTED